MCCTCHAADNMEYHFLVIYLQRYVKNYARKNNIDHTFIILLIITKKTINAIPNMPNTCTNIWSISNYNQGIYYNTHTK